MKNYVFNIPAAFAIPLFLIFVACDTSDMENDVPRIPTRIEVSSDVNSIPVGTQKKFTAIAYDQNGQSIDKLWIDWGSMSEGIASVNSVGMVSALASGETTITASAGGVSGSAPITITAVNPQDSRISKLLINGESEEVTIGIGKSKKLEGQVLDQYDTPYHGMEILWQSMDKTVVEIDREGVLTGISAGMADVQMSVGRYRATIAIIVSDMPSVPTTIDISPLSSRQSRGETITFTAKVLDQYGIQMDDVAVEWTNSNSCSISLNESGQATAVSAGEAEITAKTGNISGKGIVTVSPSQVIIPASIEGNWIICSPSLNGILQLSKGEGSDGVTGIITGSDGLTRMARGTYSGNVLSLRWESIVHDELKISFIRGARHTDQYLLEGILVEGKENSNIRISRSIN